MDAELLELQKQFESAQQAKSSIRLSDRNVVELIQKLQDLKFIDFDLLHTVSGKEYITPDRLRIEILSEIKKAGRVSLIDLSDIIGVDLYYIEKEVHSIVGNNSGLMLVQGEIISQNYWDTVAEEVNEKLRECSQIAIADLAAQLHVGSEMVLSFLEPRIGTMVKGRLEGGQLYTPAYVARITAMVRGAVRGVTVPTNLSMVWSSLQQLLQELNGFTGVSVEGTMFQSQFSEQVKEGEILGSLRAGTQWTPSVFAYAQRESVDSFFSQNSFITYDILSKLAIPQPKHYLQSRYSEGIPLVNAFIHPSMVEMIDTAIEDAVEAGNWIDSLTVLPSSLSSLDAAILLTHCPFVQVALKSSKAVILGESSIFSNVFINDLFNKLEKELETLGHTFLTSRGPSEDLQPSKDNIVSQFHESGNDGDDNNSSRHVSQKGSKKKKGKSTGSAKTAVTESYPDLEENASTRGKKNQRKNKYIGTVDAAESKLGTNKGLSKSKVEGLNIPSEEWVFQHILSLYPSLEDLGDPHEVIKQLSSHLRPMLVNSWKNRRNTILMESAERRKRLIDNLQKQLDEAFLDLQLHEKALDLFQDDSSTSNLLQKHLLKTSATSIVDKLLLNLDVDSKLMNGIEVELSNVEQKTLSSGDRIALAKGLTGSVSVKAQAVVEALEGKQVEAFINSLFSIASESGLLLKKLDKKLERTLLHSYRKELTAQISSETDPVAFLPKVVTFLYLQVHNKALQAPGRAISVALSRLKDKLPSSTYEVLMDYHSTTVTLLALLAARTDDEEDCTSDRILSKRELLESKMPELKALVLNPSDS